MPAVNNLTLFVACVVIWSTTWYAITFQLGPVPAEVSVAWRFMLAALVIAAWCRFKGHSLKFTPSEHVALALMGVTMFTAGYIFVYHAEKYLVSGLVAVGYSAGPLLALFGMRLFFGQRLTARMAIGSAFGVIGIVLVFWHEFAQLSQARGAGIGALLTVLAVLVSTVGGLLAHRNHTRGLHGLPTIALSMGYGGVFALVASVALGRTLTIETTPAYLLSLTYLTVIGTVAAFVSWLTLIGRVGPAKASYVGVMVPVVALMISALFETLAWHPLMIAGMAVSVAGNVLVLNNARATA